MTLTVKLNESYFLPNESVSGTVTWKLEKNQIANEVIVMLKWYTDGKSDEDMQVIAQEKVSHPDSEGSHDFTLQLPQFPWSYEGQLFSIKWCIEAQINKKIQIINIICSPKKKLIEQTRSDLNPCFDTFCLLSSPFYRCKSTKMTTYRVNNILCQSTVSIKNAFVYPSTSIKNHYMKRYLLCLSSVLMNKQNELKFLIKKEFCWD
jgi:hypothetical protein